MKKIEVKVLLKVNINMEARYYVLIRFVEFYFGFKDYRVFGVSHRLAASNLLY